MSGRLAILGATGSIGTNVLKVVAALGDRFTVTALAADSNITLLAEQARRFKPRVISVGTRALAARTAHRLGNGTKVVWGAASLEAIVRRGDVDIVVCAISGTACLVPLVRAIDAGKRIALANKESLVSAGEIVMARARARGVTIVPVDSEHSAIFQCLDGKRQYLEKIYLTGSGGPLLDVDRRRFDTLDRRAILRHPKWRMGRKISVDSATMMNKGLEVIEACRLFSLDEKKVEVLIHPEAIIHSMVGLVDGTVFAQLGIPDMRTPIQYALTYPLRSPMGLARIDPVTTGAFTFRKPDQAKFPCLALAREAIRRGGTYPASLCAADEEAVAAYLDGAIPFSRIPGIIEKVVMRHRNVAAPGLDDILEAERRSKEEVRNLCYH